MDGQYEYSKPLEPGESIRMWLGEVAYIEYYRMTEAEYEEVEPILDDSPNVLTSDWTVAIYNANGKLLSRSTLRYLPRGKLGFESDYTLFNTGIFRLDVMPNVYGDGYILGAFHAGCVDFGDQDTTVAAILSGDPPATVSVEVLPTRPFLVSACLRDGSYTGNIVATGTGGKLYSKYPPVNGSYDALNDRIMDITAPAWHNPMPGGVGTTVSLLDADDETLWSGTVTMLPIHRIGHGVLASRTSGAEGTITVEDGNLEDGEQVRNIWWDGGIKAYGRIGATCQLDGDTLTISGGEGDDLPDYITLTGVGLLYNRISDSEGWIDQTGVWNLQTGIHTVRITWLEGEETRERVGVEADIRTTWCTFSGGSGTSLPEEASTLTLHQTTLPETEVHILESPPEPWTLRDGGAMQVVVADGQALPPSPSSGMQVVLPEKPQGYHTTGMMRKWPEIQFVYPWAFSLVVTDHLDPDTNTTYTLQWQYCEGFPGDSGNGWFYQHVERNEADELTVLVRLKFDVNNETSKWLRAELDVWRTGMYAPITDFDFAQTVFAETKPTTFEKQINDPVLFPFTSNGSLENLVFDCNDLISASLASWPYTSFYTGTIAVYWPEVNDPDNPSGYTRLTTTTGRVTAPAGFPAIAYPPIGATVTVTWQGRTDLGDPYTTYDVQAEITFTDDDGTFEVTTWLEGTTLIPDAEIYSGGAFTYYLSPSDYMPEFSATLTCIDHEP